MCWGFCLSIPSPTLSRLLPLHNRQIGRLLSPPAAFICMPPALSLRSRAVGLFSWSPFGRSCDHFWAVGCEWKRYILFPTCARPSAPVLSPSPYRRGPGGRDGAESSSASSRLGARLTVDTVWVGAEHLLAWPAMLAKQSTSKNHMCNLLRQI